MNEEYNAEYEHKLGVKCAMMVVPVLWGVFGLLAFIMLQRLSCQSFDIELGVVYSAPSFIGLQC